MDIQAQKIELIQMLLSTTKPNVIKKIKAIFEEANGGAFINSSMTVAQLEKEIEEAKQKFVDEGGRARARDGAEIFD